MIRRIPVRNAMSNQNEVLEGEIIDTLPTENSVYVDRTGRTYDATKGVRMSDLPQSGVVQLPRTTWYGFDPKPVPEELIVVGYLNGPDGCVPIYEGRTHAHRTNRRSHPDDLGSAATPRGGRNWRARKAANARESLAVVHPERGSSGSTE